MVFPLFSDIHKAVMAVAEGTACLLAADFPHMSRACMEVRLEAHLSAAKGIPEPMRRGVVHTEPLSEGLFSHKATDRVYSSIPTMIHMPSPHLPR